jgi:guanylate kinase
MDEKIRRRGLMLAISSPSGAGKTSISRALLQEDQNIDPSISYTTRRKRESEEAGVDYHFVDEKNFMKMVQDNKFLEHAHIFNNMYGTPRAAVEESLAQGKDVLFDIDWQGVQQISQAAHMDLVTVFILPPSWQELEKRLYSRGQDDDEVIAHRMSEARSEISHWAEYDYIIINEDLNASVEKVAAILKGERLRRYRQEGLAKFVSDLLDYKKAPFSDEQ